MLEMAYLVYYFVNMHAVDRLSFSAGKVIVALHREHAELVIYDTD